MDILSHTFSGIAAVTVALPFTDFTSKQKFYALALGAFVGAFPDLDAISLWSGFGKKGEEIYFGKEWFSHHAINHSLFMGILLVATIQFFRTKKYTQFGKSEIYLSIALFTGFVVHLLEDMPTPHCTWGGVRFFYPFQSYAGGSGKIWWWNNYDLFLLIICTSVTNIIAYWLIKKDVKMVVLLNTLCFIFVFFYQINNRKYNYNYIGFSTNYTTLESNSLEEQKNILGDDIYQIMYNLDKKIPLNF